MVKLLMGDVDKVLERLPDKSVQMAVTSPPYWSVRDYGVDGQIGHEPTVQAYVQRLVGVFRELRRVLRDDGTFWLNIGDSFSTTDGAYGRSDPISQKSNAYKLGQYYRTGKIEATSGLPPKNLVLVPYRVAMALQQPYEHHIITDAMDRIWMAGLVDGEGCITIIRTDNYKNGVKCGQGSWPPILQIKMCDLECISKVEGITGYAMNHNPEPATVGGVRESHTWKLISRRAVDVIADIYPYLLIKRKQAIVAWNHQKIREDQPKFRKATEEIVEKQKMCCRMIQSLNHQRPVDIPSWMEEPHFITEPGWVLRQDIVWNKTSCLPEPTKDRPSSVHEHMFLFAKSQHYYYDKKATGELVSFGSLSSNGTKFQNSVWTLSSGSSGINVCKKCNRLYHPDEYKRLGNSGTKKPRVDGTATQRKGMSDDNHPEARAAKVCSRCGGTEWEAHAAPYPQKLVAPCIMAGTSDKGACVNCGTCWVRDGKSWKKNCECKTNDVRPCVVLDPFNGSGTTGVVALRLGRSYLGVDLSPAYTGAAYERLARVAKVRGIEL